MSASFFKKPVVMVTFAPRDATTEGWVVIERPALTTCNGVTFITGYHSAESAACIRGRRVLIPLHCVTSITEYDTTSEVWEAPKKRARSKK